MPTILLPLLPGSLPPGVCYNNEQARLNAFAENLQAQLNGQAFYNYGSSVPAVEYNNYPWLRTQDMRWYMFNGGWISPVGPEYNTQIRKLWAGSLNQLQTYDGGDVNPASDRSGPMWVEDVSFAGRSPMHPGAIPDASPSKTLAVLENYGTGSHTNTIQEMVKHHHAMKFALSDDGSTNPTASNGDGDDLSFNTEDAGAVGETPTPFNLTHPVKGLYVIKWSGRAYRRAV